MADNPLAQMAGAGASGTTDMFNQLMQQAQQKQGYLQQQQEAYNRDLEKYAQMAQELPALPEAAMWGSMAESIQPYQREGQLGSMLASAGGAYGKFQAADSAETLKRQKELTRMRQDEVRALEARDQNSALLRAMGGGKSGLTPTVKVVDGKLVKYDPATGGVEVLTGSQDQMKSKLYQTFYKAAIDQERPNPEAYAQEQTERTLAGFGGTTVKGVPSAIPGVRAVGQPSMEEPAPEITGAKVEPAVLDLLSDKDAATAARLMARINANPAAAKNDIATLDKLVSRYSTAKQPQTPEAFPTATMSYVDKAKKEMEKESAKVSGKALAEEVYGMQEAAGTSSQLVGQLGLLKQIYQNPKIPEGELGPQIQSIKSSLKSLGIDVGAETGAADLAKSVAGKMALLTRTADGKNLMPGAMSDFEQKILQGLVPGLSGTAEGRVALIDMMQEIAKSRIRMAEEASKFIDERGVVSPEWMKRKQRLMKEEMARVADFNRQIASRFQGAK